MRTTAVLFVRLSFVCLASVATLGVPASGKDLPTAKPEEVGVSSEKVEELSDFMQSLVNDGKIAGGVTMMARRGKVIHLEAVGMADREAKKPMQTDAIFRIASMTKPITSVAIMMLCEEGRLSLDDPIAKYIPELMNPKVMVALQPLKSEPAKREITIRHLLTHTAGFTYCSNSVLGLLYKRAGIISSGLSPRRETVAEDMKRLGGIPLLFHPGDQFGYGMSTDVLGRVVEVIAGMPLDSFFAEKIFEPLGMDDTYFQVPADKWHRVPVVYVKDGTGPLRPVPNGKAEVTREGIPYSADLTYKDVNRYLSGGGGLCSTASDYMRFCQMLLNGGQLNGTRLLRDVTVKMMRINQIDGLSVRFYNGDRFGLGFRVIEKAVRTKDLRLVGGFGWSGFFDTSFLIVPDGDWILIVMAQRVSHDNWLEWISEYESLAAAAIVD